MAARRPYNGRQVFVALHEVKPTLRERVATRLAEQEAQPTAALELRIAAAHPRLRPDGTPYGAWVSAEDAARVKRGLLPRAAKRSKARR